jgi:hypothetical protein
MWNQERHGLPVLTMPATANSNSWGTTDSEVRLWRSTKPELNLEFEQDGHYRWHYTTKESIYHYIHRISFDNTSNSK